MRLTAALVSVVGLSACLGGGPSSAPDGYYTLDMGAVTIDVPDRWVQVRPDGGDFDVQVQGPGDRMLFAVERTVTTNDVDALLGDQRSARVEALPGYEEVGGPRAVTVIGGDGVRIDYTYASETDGVQGRGVDVVTLGPGNAGLLVSVTATDAAYDEREFDTIANSIRYTGG